MKDEPIPLGPGRSATRPVRVLVPLLLAFFSYPLSAHHGRDFLLTQSASLPHTGDLYLIPQQSYLEEGDDEEIEVEPALLLGLTPRVAVEVHSHLAKEGSEDWEYESTAPALHLRLNSASQDWGLGLSLEYEVSHLDDHADVAEAVLILSRDTQHGKVAFNVIAGEEQEAGAELEWGYAAAYRVGVNDRFAVGLEFLGDLEEPADGEALVGVYFDRSRFSLNLGIGTSYGDQELDLSLRSSLVLRLGD